MTDIGLEWFLCFQLVGQASAGEIDDNSPVGTMAGKVSIKFQYSNGTEKKLTNLKNPVRLGIKQDPNQLRISDSDIEYSNPEIHDDFLFYHKVNVTQKNSAITITFRYIFFFFFLLCPPFNEVVVYCFANVGRSVGRPCLVRMITRHRIYLRSSKLAQTCILGCT